MVCIKKKEKQIEQIINKSLGTPTKWLSRMFNSPIYICVYLYNYFEKTKTKKQTTGIA